MHREECFVQGRIREAISGENSSHSVLAESDCLQGLPWTPRATSSAQCGGRRGNNDNTPAKADRMRGCLRACCVQQNMAVALNEQRACMKGEVYRQYLYCRDAMNKIKKKITIVFDSLEMNPDGGGRIQHIYNIDTRKDIFTTLVPPLWRSG